MSCDLKPTEQPGPHHQGDVRDILNDGWDLMIAHPPCTYLSYAGMRWFKVQPDRMEKAKAAFSFFMDMVHAPIPRIVIENGRGFALKWYRQADQIIQPYQFGEPATKATCLWMKNMPPLLYTCLHMDPVVNWARNGKFSHTGESRSRTFPGIARAMAQQWSKLPCTVMRDN